MIEQIPKIPVDELPLAEQLVRLHGAEIDVTDRQPTSASVIVTAANHLPGAMGRADKLASQPPVVVEQEGALDDRKLMQWHYEDGTTAAVSAIDGQPDKLVHRL